jgi:hypothetical protein
VKTIGIVGVAALAANAGTEPPVATIMATCRRQSLELILGPAVFDRDVLAFDKADVFEALAECTQTVRIACWIEGKARMRM